jgi:hypothetical protein
MARRWRDRHDNRATISVKTRTAGSKSRVLPQLSCSGTGGLGSMGQPLAEPTQLGWPIALPLPEFRFGDLAFNLPVTVGRL